MGADLAEIKEKMQEITDESAALRKELLMEEEEDGMMDERLEKVLVDGDDVQRENVDEIEFDLKEDEIKFVDVNKEMKKMEKLKKRINKMVDKQVKLVEDTEIKFVNTLKKFHEEDKGDLDIENLKAALNETLHESKFSDDEIEKFWNELHEIKEREPDMPLSKRIEVLIDQYEEDIDIKDIKKKDKENKAD